jgi:WD40 repeat protein
MYRMLIVFGLFLLLVSGAMWLWRSQPSQAWFLGFVSNRSGSHQVYWMRPDGTLVNHLSRQDFRQARNNKSPDGQWVVYSQFREGNWDVYRRRADNSAVFKLTSDPGNDWQAVWSPDGQWLIVESERDGNRELYRMRPNGLATRNLTQHPAFDCCVAFSDLLDFAWHPGGLGIIGLITLIAGSAYFYRQTHRQNRSAFPDNFR